MVKVLISDGTRAHCVCDQLELENVFDSRCNLVPRARVTLVQRNGKRFPVPLDKGNDDSGDEVVLDVVHTVVKREAGAQFCQNFR